MELIFEIRDAEEGGFYARALGHGIFTEADSWDELRANLLEAVSLHFEDATKRPRLVQMHYVKDELIPLEAARNYRAACPARRLIRTLQQAVNESRHPAGIAGRKRKRNPQVPRFHSKNNSSFIG